MDSLLKVIGISGLMLAGLMGIVFNTTKVNLPDTSSGEIILSEHTYPSTHSVVALNSDQNEYLVVWNSQQADGYSFRGQRVSRDGVLIGQNFTVTSGISTPLLPYAPTVAYNSNRKEYLVVWNDETFHLRGQRVLSDGARIGTFFVITTPLSSTPLSPALVYSSQHDEFLLAWRGCISAAGRETSPTGSGMCYFYTQLLDGTGAWLSDNITATNASSMQSTPAIAYIPGQDEYWIVWTEQTSIVGQRIQVNGLLSGIPFTISQSTSEMLDPSISNVSKQGEMLVTWADGRYSQYTHQPAGGGYHNIYAQRVLSNGLPLGDNFRVSSNPISLEPKVAYLSERNQYFVTWTTLDVVNHDHNLYARWIMSTGMPLGNEVPVASTLQDQQDPAVAGWDAAFLLWSDDRGAPDVRGRLMQTPTWVYLPTVMLSAQ